MNKDLTEQIKEIRRNLELHTLVRIRELTKDIYDKKSITEIVEDFNIANKFLVALLDREEE